jgi:hypothetical protein
MPDTPALPSLLLLVSRIHPLFVPAAAAVLVDQGRAEPLVRPVAFSPAAVPLRLLSAPAERALRVLALVVGAVTYGCVMPPL